MIDNTMSGKLADRKVRRCPTCGQVIGGSGQRPRPLPGPRKPRPLPGPRRPRPLPSSGRLRPFPEQPIRRTLPWKPKPRPWKKELYERKRREEGRARLR